MHLCAPGRSVFRSWSGPSDGLDRRTEKGISIRRLRLCTICTKAGAAAAFAMCAASDTATAPAPTSCLAPFLSVRQLVTLSVRASSAEEIMFICSGLFTRSLSASPMSLTPFPSSAPPHSGWLPRCCSDCSMACGCGGRCGCGIAKSHFENSSPRAATALRSE